MLMQSRYAGGRTGRFTIPSPHGQAANGQRYGRPPPLPANHIRPVTLTHVYTWLATYDPDLSEALHMNVVDIEGLVAVGYSPSKSSRRSASATSTSTPLDPTFTLDRAARASRLSTAYRPVRDVLQVPH